MGLVDKLRNIFTEEVEEEEEEPVRVEQIKKEVRSVPIESPSVEKVTTSREEMKKMVEPEVPVIEEKEKPKAPVFFTDRDFEDLETPKKSREQLKQERQERVEREEPKVEAPKPYSGNYNNTTIIQKEKQVFKPTPIISPVYGVLDKNYHKEDIVEKQDSPRYSSVDGLSVDSIRNKAYGTLEDDLEDTMVRTPIVEKEEEEEDLFEEMEKKEQPKKDDVSAKITEQEKNIKELEEITMDLTKELDNLLLQKEKDKKSSKSEPETRTERAEKKEKQEDVSDSDLFNLIDSMYDEGEGEE